MVVKKLFTVKLLLTLFYCLFSLGLRAQKDTVKLQLKWWHQFQFAGYYAADIKGYYKDAGLNVKIIPGDVNHPPVQEVLAGRATFSITGSDLLIDFSQGKPVVALGALFQHSPYVIISLRNKNIHSPSDLIGKKIMASENQGWVELQSMFLKEGIPLDSLHIVNHTWKNTDLINRNVDAMTGYLSVEPFQLKKLGADITYMQPINYGIDFYGDILFAAKSTVESKPDMVEKFMTASFKGWEYAMTHPHEMADYILTLPGVKERGITKGALLNEAGEMSKLVLPDLIEIGHMNKGRWEHILDLHKKLKLIPQSQQLTGFLYNPHKASLSRFLKIALYVLAVGLMIIGFFIFNNLALKKAVNKRTRELEREMANRTIAQKQLQTSEERLNMATQAAGLAIWDWDIVNNTVYYNDLWYTITGYEPKDFAIDNFLFVNLIHPDDKTGWITQLKEHLKGKIDNFRVIGRLKTKEGKWKWILTMSQASLRDAEGKVTRLTGVSMDIDDIKHKEIALSELSKELMKSNEELRQFAYITSHNLRAPVANLLQLMKLFDRTNLSERNLDICDKTIISIEKLSSTLTDLNDILSVRNDKTDKNELLFFEDRIHQVLDSVSEEIKATQAIIKIDCKSVNKVVCPRKVLDSILLNLVTNAIKYRKKNVVPEINISTAENQDYIILSVEDNGTGIDLERYRHKLFGLYQRFHKEVDGKGMGLYIIKSQIESTGGMIVVSSEIDKGSTFTVYFKKSS